MSRLCTGMRLPGLLALVGYTAAVAFLLALLAASDSSAHSVRAERDQQRALRQTVAWLSLYPHHVWVGADLPGDCERLRDGRRSCPIAIRLRVHTSAGPEAWRCAAHVVLPASPTKGPAHRTSARCVALPAPVASVRIPCDGPGGPDSTTGGFRAAAPDGCAPRALASR